MTSPEKTIGLTSGYFFGRCCRYRYTRDIEKRGRQLVAGETLTQVAPGDIRYRTVLLKLGLRHTVGRGGWIATCDYLLPLVGRGVQRGTDEVPLWPLRVALKKSGILVTT